MKAASLADSQLARLERRVRPRHAVRGVEPAAVREQVHVEADAARRAGAELLALSARKAQGVGPQKQTHSMTEQRIPKSIVRETCIFSST